MISQTVDSCLRRACSYEDGGMTDGSFGGLFNPHSLTNRTVGRLRGIMPNQKDVVNLSNYLLQIELNDLEFRKFAPSCARSL